MEEDIYALPEVEIRDWEDRVFTAAEALLGYLHAYGTKLSRAALEGQFAHLGVTDAQLPALLDLAERRKVLTDAAPAGLRQETARIPAMGALLLERLDAHCITIREGERRVLRLLYGLEDGVPRSAGETAALMEITRERVINIELRAFQRLSRRVRQSQRRYRHFFG